MMEKKRPFHEEVAQEIIKRMEDGTAPWLKPWRPGEWQEPHNPISGNRYRGINNLYLSMSGYSDTRWLTYKQASDKGWQVRKGEKSRTIQYWKFQETLPKLNDDGKPVIDADGKPEKITVKLDRPKVFYAKVFNAEQIDGVPPMEVKPITWNAHEKAEAIIANSGASIHHDQADNAYYRPSTDKIHMPDQASFETADNYHATILHELGHWTGHPSRLDRDMAHPFGSAGYAKEELRAEISSFMFNTELGLGHDPGQHVAYVKSWVKALKEDPQEIFRAAADAEKIRDFVLGLEQKQVQEVEQNQALSVVSSYLARFHDYRPTVDDKQALMVGMNNGDAPIVAAITLAEAKRLPLTDEGLIFKATELTAINTPPKVPGLSVVELGAADSSNPEAARYGLAKENGETFYTEVDFKNNQAQLVGVKGDRQGAETADGTRKASALEYKEFLRGLDSTYLASSRLGDLIEAHDRGDQMTKAIEPDLMAEFRGHHQNSFTGYSVLESVYSLNRAAENFNLRFDVERNTAGADDEAPYSVKYLFLDGSETGITSELWQDGKAATSVDGLRLSSTGLTSDHGWQRDALERAVTMVADRQQVNAAMLPEQAENEATRAVALMVVARELYEQGDEARAEEVEYQAAQIARLQLPASGVTENPFNQAEEPMLHRQFEKGLGDQKMLQEQQSKTFIDVPYAEKNEAKALGAKWDRGAKSWYVDGLADPEVFGRWMPNMASIEATAAQAFMAGGIEGMNNATRDSLGFDLPADWSGQVQIRGNLEVTIDGQPHVEQAESVGQPPQFWSVYAETKEGLHLILADYDSEEQAQGMSDTLGGIQKAINDLQGHSIESRRVVGPNRAHEGENAALAVLASGHRAWGFGGDWKRAEAAALANAQSLLKPQQDATKVYLAVPYDERSEAKALGARWDGEAKSWYVPSSVDSATVAKWMPDAKADRPSVLPDEEFRDALVAAGFIFKLGEKPEMDGKMHRVRVEGDSPGQRGGAYVGYLDGKPAGFYENHRLGIKQNWTSTGTTLSPEQRQALAAEAEQKRLVREAQREKSYAHHAKRCQQLWTQLRPAANNAYLQAKGVDQYDVRQDKQGRLVVPLRDENDEICSIQRIDKNGFKSLKKGAKKSGAYHTLNAQALNGSSVILVAEGYSTAATLAKATNLPTVEAIDAGNLPKVAASLKAKHPDKEIVICGDDDRFNSKGNKGREKAEEAAELVGTVALFPRFVNGEKNRKLTDWNDLYQESGLDSVKSQLAGPLGLLNAKTTLERREVLEEARNKTKRSSMAR